MSDISIPSFLKKRLGEGLKFYQIVAIDKNGLIGVDGELPWGRKWKDDLYFFRNLTLDRYIVYGYNTMISLPFLLDRRHPILLGEENRIPVGLASKIDKQGNPYYFRFNKIVKSLSEIKNDEDLNKEDHIFIIGGGKTYLETIDGCDAVIMNVCEKSFDKDGDKTYFCMDKLKERFELAHIERHVDSEIGNYTTQVYVKRM